MVRWIKVPVGREVGFGSGDIVLDGTKLPPKGHSPPIFSRFLLWRNSWVDQDATWYGPDDIVLDGAQLPPPEKGGTVPNFQPMSIVAKWLPISATAELLFCLI